MGAPALGLGHSVLGCCEHPSFEIYIYIYGFYICLKKQTLYQCISRSGTEIQYANTASSVRLTVTAAVFRT